MKSAAKPAKSQVKLHNKMVMQCSKTGSIPLVSTTYTKNPV